MTVAEGFFPVNKEEMDKQSGVQHFVFLKEGITQCRILPPYSSRGIWCRELREHKVTLDGMFLTFTCPRFVEDSACPFCEEGARLNHQGDEASVAASKEYRPKKAFLFNTLIYSAPGDISLRSGVKVIKVGKKVTDQILDLDQDVTGGWGNIYSLEAGIDIRITAKGAGMSREYIVKPVAGRTNILDTLKTQGITEVLRPVDLDKLLPVQPYAKLAKVLRESKGAVDSPGLNPYSGPLEDKVKVQPLGTFTDSAMAPPDSEVPV